MGAQPASRHAGRWLVGAVALAAVVALIAWLLVRHASTGTVDSAAGEPPAKEAASQNQTDTGRMPTVQALQRWQEHDQSARELRKKVKLPDKPIRRGGAANAIDSYAINPYARSSDQPPDCQTTTESAQSLPAPSTDYFDVVTAGTTAVRINMDPGSFCKLPIAQFSNWPLVVPGLGQRIYYLTDDNLRSAQNATAIAYSAAQPNQQYRIAIPKAESVYLRAVPSADVLATSGQCPSCDFRMTELASGYYFENADISGSDFSGSTLYKITFGANSNLKSTIFGEYDKSPAVLAEVAFTGADLSGAAFRNLTIDTTNDFDGATWSVAPVFTSDIIEFPGIKNWNNITFDKTTFLVGSADRAALAGTKDSPKSVSLTLTDSAFLGTPPDFSYVDWQKSTLSRTEFQKAVFNYNNLCGVSAGNAHFDQASMVAANLSGAFLRGAGFDNALISYASFNEAALGELKASNNDTSRQAGPAAAASATSSSTDPQPPQPVGDCKSGDTVKPGAAASMVKADLRAVNFTGADLRKVDFTGSYLFHSTAGPQFGSALLDNAIFTNALLSKADFSQATLTNADFSSAQCISCRFTDATLTGTRFISAYLFGAEISSASTLNGADFRNSLCCSDEAGNWIWAAGLFADAPKTPYVATTMAGVKFDQAGTCPDGVEPDSGQGCAQRQGPRNPPPDDPPCDPAATYICAMNINTLAGNGTAGYSPGAGGQGDSGQAATSVLNNPARVVAYDYAPDPAQPTKTRQRLLIADTGNSVVRAVDLTTKTISVVAGRPGQKTSDGTSPLGDGGPATKATLDGPTGLAVDTVGRIYVADTGNNRIRRINSDGTIVTVAGDGTKGSSGQRVPAIKAQLNAPEGVGVICGEASDCRIYIADTGNHKVRVVGIDDKISLVAGTGAPGKSFDGTAGTSSKLNTPTDVVLDDVGNVYVADSQNNRVLLVGVDNKTYTYEPLPGELLGHPVSLYMDPLDNLYITAASQDPKNPMNTVIRVNYYGSDDPGAIVNKDGTAGFSGDGGDSMAAQLNNPQGVAVTSSNQVFIADTNNQRIRELVQR